jgi:hypothetical protein
MLAVIFVAAYGVARWQRSSHATTALAVDAADATVVGTLLRRPPSELSQLSGTP